MVNQVVLGVTLLTVIVAAASLVVRFRRARGIGRQQLRWVAWAAVLVVLAAIIALASAALGCRRWLAGRPGSVWRCCLWPSGRRSCAIGSMTWTTSSAAP